MPADIEPDRPNAVPGAVAATFAAFRWSSVFSAFAFAACWSRFCVRAEVDLDAAIGVPAGAAEGADAVLEELLPELKDPKEVPVVRGATLAVLDEELDVAAEVLLLLGELNEPKLVDLPDDVLDEVLDEEREDELENDEELFDEEKPLLENELRPEDELLEEPGRPCATNGLIRARHRTASVSRRISLPFRVILHG